MTFEVNDIKALMTLMYTSVSTDFLSSRNNDSESAGDIEFDENGRPEDIGVRDTNPGTFHVIAANYLGIRHQSFAEDRTYDLEVWNQPIRGFEVTQKKDVTPIEANALVGVTTVGGETVEHAGTVAKDEWLHFDPVEVEAGQSVKVSMTGTGDGDLHVRFDEQPTASDYDCRPYDGGSNETCEIQVPEGKSKVFASVKGYAETSDVELTINYGGEVATEYAFNANADRLIHIKATLQYITESASNVDGNLADTIGTYTRSDHYEYVLELDHQGWIIGGEWVGDSVREHPDFLWLPLSQTGASKAGGKITYDKVKLLLDMSVAEVDPNEDDDDDDGNTSDDTVSGTVAQGEWKHYGPYTVDFNQNLTAAMTGTGDADLYVKLGAQPDENDYDCRPYENGSSETCTVGGPGDAYVSVYGYDTSSDYTVVITWETGEDGGDEGNDDGGDDGGDDDGGNGGDAEVEQNGTVAAEDWLHYGPFDVAEGGHLLAEMTGTGDADLYVKVGSQPTADSYDCRPYASGSEESCDVDGPGAVYVSVNGYAETSDFELYIIYSAS